MTNCGVARRCKLFVNKASMAPLSAAPLRFSNEKVKVTKSSGNVFRDLGFSEEEAVLLAMRSDLMGQLPVLIRRRKWTQAAAAEALGITQSRVSDLVRGQMGEVQPGYAADARGKSRPASSIDDVEGRIATKGTTRFCGRRRP